MYIHFGFPGRYSLLDNLSKRDYAPHYIHLNDFAKPKPKNTLKTGYCWYFSWRKIRCSGRHGSSRDTECGFSERGRERK